MAGLADDESESDANADTDTVSDAEALLWEDEDSEATPEAIEEAVAQMEAAGLADADGEHDPTGAERPGNGQMEAQSHNCGVAEPAGQKDNTGHVAHVALEDVPVILLNVPARQRVAFTEDHGQNEPAGQVTGAPLEQ